MNLTSNITNSSSEPSHTGPGDPWVESGALVYVAMTIAVCAAVIMCCTWFLTNNETSKALYAKYCWKKNIYNEVVNDEEEEIELRLNQSPQDSDDELQTGEFIKSLPEIDVFTLEDSEDEFEGNDVEGKDVEFDEDEVNAV